MYLYSLGKRLARCFRTSSWRLAFFWCLGLVVGVLFARTATIDAPILIADKAEPVVLFTSGLLPFTLAWGAMYFQKRPLLYILSFLFSSFFLFTGFCIFSAYGSAGWLARLLLQFTGIGLTPLFYLFCLRLLSVGREALGREALCFFLAAAILILLDILVVTPLWLHI